MASKQRFKLSQERIGDIKRHVDQKASDTLYQQEGIVEIPLELIDPASWNARKHFDKDALKRLADDIAANGLIQAITVRPKNERYEVVAGERRFRATRLLGHAAIKANVRQLDEAAAHQVALLENLNREDLNSYEETIGYLQLLEIKLSDFEYFKEIQQDTTSQEAVIKILNRLWNETKQPKAYRSTNNVISKQVKGSQIEDVILSTFTDLGKMSWESFFQNRLPLLRLPQDVLDTLNRGTIPYTKARLLARIENESTRVALTQEVIEQGHSVSKLRRLVKSHISQDAPTSLLDQVTEISKLIRKYEIEKDSDKRQRIDVLLKEIRRICN